MENEKPDYKTRCEIYTLIIIFLLIGLLFNSCEASSAKSEVEELKCQIEELEWELSNEYDRGYESGYDDGYDEALHIGR